MKARESFFFGMIPVLFPILSDRCRNSVVFFNHCFTDTHLNGRGVFLCCLPRFFFFRKFFLYFYSFLTAISIYFSRLAVYNRDHTIAEQKVMA